MQTIRTSQKTAADGVLSLRIPLGEPETDFDIVIVVQPKEVDRGWPPGYFDLAGSIDDETFIRQPQGSLPKPVELD